MKGGTSCTPWNSRHDGHFANAAELMDGRQSANDA